jgi:hypothetical protein
VKGATLVVFDYQHRGKPPPRHDDAGAGFDLDGDGVVGAHETEIGLVPGYLGPAGERLVELGHSTVWITTGTYADRHRRVNELARRVGPTGRVAYIAAHLNAGAGGKLQRALTLHDARSSSGKRLAATVASSLNQVDALARGRGSHVFAARDSDWTHRALNTIRGVYAGPAWLSGVCLEPLFVDAFPPPTGELLHLVGEALADGIAAWLVRGG